MTKPVREQTRPEPASNQAAIDQPPEQLLPQPDHAARKRPAFWRRRPTLRQAVWGSLAVVTVLVLGVGGFLSWRAYANLHKVFHGSGTVASLAKNVVPDDLKKEGDSRVNILLLGVGGPTHQGPDLTDTIVVLSVDPVNNKASLLSVPRDLWVQQPVNFFGKQQKINAVYESGKYHYIGHLDSSNKNGAAVQAGFAAIDQSIKEVLGLDISYHVLVNFQAFQQAIDTVGGVDVDVPTDLIDPTMAWENRNNPVLAKAGLQHMGGGQALMYARSRETTSDFARTERQRQILLALKDKVLTAGTLSNPAKIDGLLSAFGDNVYADMSTDAAWRLYGIMQHIDDSQVESISLVDKDHPLVTTDRVGTASVVRPLAGFDEYDAIQTYVHSQLADGHITKENAGVTVLAADATAAQTAGETLQSYGYNVVATDVVTGSFTKPVVVDLSGGKAPFTRHYLENRYGVKAGTVLPAGVRLPEGARAGGIKFVIILPT